ncbi:MAG: hypothetical protein N3B01_05805, partial [Verrucomicrobiae bacterium]|nr:hypothetical protein [Verrucomicrobiae bacterium]
MKLWQLRVSERQTLHMILAVCLIGVLSAFVVVFVRRQSPAPPMARYPLARWISPRATEAHDWRIRIAELDDPSLMSLPHPRAFSAALWQRQA